METDIQNIEKQKNKLKEYKQDLMIIDKKINKIREENYKIKIEKVDLENNILKLNKVKNKILKYKKKIIKTGFDCILCLILCFILVSFFGLCAAQMLAIKKLESIFILWLTFFIPMYPISLTFFSNVFSGFFKMKKYLKKHKLRNVERLLRQKSNNKYKNDQEYLLNEKRLQNLEIEQSIISKDFEKIFFSFCNDEQNENVDDYINDREIKKLQKLKK